MPDVKRESNVSGVRGEIVDCGSVDMAALRGSRQGAEEVSQFRFVRISEESGCEDKDEVSQRK